MDTDHHPATANFVFTLTFALIMPSLFMSCLEHECRYIDLSANSDATILKKGEAGQWDHRLTGAVSPGALVELGDKFFLYYIGGPGTRSFDQGPKHRALGVATSVDGKNFVKYKGNPVLQYLPNQGQEEGIFSIAAMIDEDGTILLYYGAMRNVGSRPDLVNCYIRLATSTDGYHFTDNGIVLSHSDKRVWGYGDELSPLGAFKQNDKYFLYYLVPNGSGIKWGLAIAELENRRELVKTEPVINDGQWVIGGTVVNSFDNDKMMILLSRSHEWQTGYLEMYSISRNRPTLLRKICETNAFTHLTAACERDGDDCLMVYTRFRDPTGDIKLHRFSKKAVAPF